MKSSQVANKLYRSDDAFQEANPYASRLQVSKLVATGQEGEFFPSLLVTLFCR